METSQRTTIAARLVSRMGEAGKSGDGLEDAADRSAAGKSDVAGSPAPPAGSPSVSPHDGQTECAQLGQIRPYPPPLGVTVPEQS